MRSTGDRGALGGRATLRETRSEGIRLASVSDQLQTRLRICQLAAHPLVANPFPSCARSGWSARPRSPEGRALASAFGPLAALTASGNLDLLNRAFREWRCFSRRREQTADDFEMGFKAAVIRGRRATLRQPGTGFSIPLSMVAAVTLMLLAGCEAPGAGDLGVENEVPPTAGEGGVADPNAALEVLEEEAPDEKALESAPETPGNQPDTMTSKGRRRAPVSAFPSGGAGRGADRLDSDVETRLIEERMRVQGRINTLDTQLRAFDRNPPSRAAPESDRRGRPEAIERRLDVERRTLEAQHRRINRELRQLRYEPTPRSIGSGSRGNSSRGMFGGSGLQ